MSLKDFEEEIAVHDDYKDLDQAGWETKIEYRAITKRSQKDFDWLKELYPKKIAALRERLAGNWDFSCRISADGKTLKSDAELLDAVNAELDEWYYCNAKETRLFDKLAVVIKEEQLRKDGLVIRTGLHDQTDYYIDYDNGNDGSAGTATGTAWKTITKYTTDTVRTPGDRAFLRAGITWDQGTEAVDITFDEDGTIDLYIELIGCDSVTNDPWSDASDDKPIIDFENQAHNVVFSGDLYWRLNRLDCQQSNDGSGTIVVASSSNYNYFLNCNIQDCNAVGVEGVLVSSIEFTTFDGCTFTDCFGTSISLTNSRAFIKDCTFTAGVDVKTDVGILMDNGSTLWMQDSTFSGAFDTVDFSMDQNSIAWVRNITWSASGKDIDESSVLHSEDDDGTFESHVTYFDHDATIERDAGTVRGGGADSSAKMTPDALIGPNRPLMLGDRLRGFRPIWAEAGSYTATVYVRVGSAWDSALTAAECYLITSELDNAGTAARVERQSAQTIANDTTWTALTTSISPARDGFVYFWIYLAEFEDASEHIFVDILPTVV